MKFQLPVKGCFLQRCHEINDERKRERERDGGRKSAAQTTPWKYPVRGDGVPFSSAQLGLIWLKFSLIILIAFFHTRTDHCRGRSADIARSEGMQRHSQCQCVVPLRCQASCSALLVLGMKAFHFTSRLDVKVRRKESLLDCPHCTAFQIDMPLAHLDAFFMFCDIRPLSLANFVDLSLTITLYFIPVMTLLLDDTFRVNHLLVKLIPNMLAYVYLGMSCAC